MSTKLFEQAAAAIDLATKDQAASDTVAMNVGDLSVILGLLISNEAQSLSLSEAREEIERLKIRECPQEAPGVDFVRLAVAKASCLAMGDDWEREGPGDVLMEAYGPLADAALSARSALENAPAGLADANTNPPLSDLSSLRKGAEVAVEALEKCEAYFDNRADADCEGDPAEFVPNKEMVLLSAVREAMAALVSGSREDGA